MQLKELNIEKKRRMRTILYLYILLALFSLLVAASYTWFALSQTPRVSDMALFISSRTGLELSTIYDGTDEGWGQEISFLDLVGDAVPLRPVTWSEERGSFLALRYGLDGRLTGHFDPLTDEANANRTDSDGYYAVGTFYARSGENCTVKLAKAVELNGGVNGAGTYVIGTPVWNNQDIIHYNGGKGAETAIRLGFLITNVSPGIQEGENTSEFIIYEPNSDRHIDGSVGYVNTPSVDGTEALSDKLICQTTSTWTEAYPVQRDVTIKQLGKFTTDTKLFSIKAGEVYQIKLYVWLEGQDMDCTNLIEDAQIIANIQFSTEYSNQGGLDEIPED